MGILTTIKKTARRVATAFLERRDFFGGRTGGGGGGDERIVGVGETVSTKGGVSKATSDIVGVGEAGGREISGIFSSFFLPK